MRFTSLIFTLLFATPSYGELTIFDVRKNLPLSNTEKVFHDYYVDSGSESGLKTGMTVTVQRRSPLYDYYRGRSVGDLMLKVAKVKVIQVQDGLAVVRLREEISREESPLTDDEFIMIGDRLDVSNAVAGNEPAPPAEVVATVSAPEPKPEARIIVNSVDLTIDPPKSAVRAPAAAPKAASK